MAFGNTGPSEQRGYLRMPVNLLNVALPLVHENQLRWNIGNLEQND